MVAHTGFEPVISSLRGRCPKPLDECAIQSQLRRELPALHTPSIISTKLPEGKPTLLDSDKSALLQLARSLHHFSLVRLKSVGKEVVLPETG